ncbi:MAG: hypothetical protein EAZ76_09765 [Nostocales cyanobacterium]|nr:MAG: hypothetical protein EAZ87_14320 [Nostocales cyanobacterium]TAF14352.1 MAG: hypothetical protein EAZ76_09765 [Nostocales cyanobacterium]
MAKKFLFTVITVVITLMVGISFFSHPATSQQVDFRVNNLESDIRRLEIRLNQIELLINKNSQIPSSRINQTPVKPQVSKDKMFDRLSTLFVELKQQVNDLEKRVKNLESGK